LHYAVLPRAPQQPPGSIGIDGTTIRFLALSRRPRSLATTPGVPQQELAFATKREWLLREECYPGEPGPITATETHFACVFFTRDHAYKLKKPVHQDSMDFSTMAARHWNCLEELRLNRRLAPHVYLDVVPLARRDDGTVRLEASGETVDWLVKMLRLDGERMLDSAIRAGGPSPHELRPALELLGRFYRDAPRIEFTANLYRRRLEAQVERNRDELLDPALGLPNALLRELTSSQLEFLARNHALIGRRVRDCGIVEGHGDLRPEHVFIGTPPCVIDCLEFDRDLRLCDPVEELAFLVLESRRAGAAWIGALALEIYAAVTADVVDPGLVDFYVAHRAVTRAKIVAWHLRDPQYRDRSPWVDIAVGYLKTGQSALARAWQRTLGDDRRGQPVG
jgi:aminoglycoside phosphotransferase family enzyme